MIRSVQLTWACALLLIALVSGCRDSPTPIPAAPNKVDRGHNDNSIIVRLVIDYGDGVQKHFVGLPYFEGMTVHDLLLAASQHGRGIRFQTRGEESTAFLVEIDGVVNSGSDGLNWVYRVNDKVADQGFATYVLSAGDTVLWKFDSYQ
ncbi:MAG: DUF4430 domain-containing protein [Planctomycetota bacterium]|nr:DUF4430 domain-containing protein [Planctomycetota bacterium]MDA1180638.1 DUF4430 domain-containing protein [Planctomycetota bacterium]